VNIAYADRLGSGVRNLYKYTPIYSGQDPKLIEGDVFTAIIPLPGSGPSNVRVDVSVDVRAEPRRLLDSERLVLDALGANDSSPIRVLAEETGLSERQVRRILVSLREYGLLRCESSERYGRWVLLQTAAAVTGPPDHRLLAANTSLSARSRRRHWAPTSATASGSAKGRRR
ncbi:MAG: hypothetical protein LBH76_05365, partial [Propionibacteriaceae bacterium]|nr:hypothetical protein [Propionibacteriaceae bacterium]